MPVFLMLGFVVDWITLNRIDQVFDNIVLFFYVLLSGIAILIFHSQIQNRNPLFKKIKELSGLLMQYAFGGLFSGLVIFYFRSSSIITSLPFLLILIILFVGNDILHKKYQKLIFQITIFYVGVFSYCNLIIPILFRQINVWIFLLASVVSLLMIHLFILLVKKVIIDRDKANNVYNFIAGVFVIFILFYFTNIIPPIPLSLKQSYVAHDIDKKTDRENGTSYIITVQETPWYIFWKKYSDDLNIFDDEPVYVFGSVFAPTNFKSLIYHQWSFFNKTTGRWSSLEKIPIEIIGGRETGFRGYSFKNNVEKGTWRVDVETARGQVIGRVLFDVKEAEDNTELVKIWR